MGAQLQAEAARRAGGSSELAAAEKELKKLNDELALDLAQAAVDAAGIVDPTPISDGVGAAMSLARGDLVGAGLSLVSMVPYLGDALGKTAKGARAAAKLDKLRKAIAATTAKVLKFRELAGAGQKISKAMHKAAAARIRAQRAVEAAKKTALAKVCKKCTKPSNRFGVRLPQKGKWAGEPGNSVFTPSTPGGKPVTFKDGYPDFGPHAKGSVEIDGFDMTGNRDLDFRNADAAMREKLGDPNWKRPKDQTWHHTEDGVTMQLVPSEIHDAAQHTGGVSIATDPGY